MAKKLKGPALIRQEEHLDEAFSQKVTGDVLAQGNVVTDDLSAGAVFVRKGSLLRIRVTSATFIAFRKDAADLSGAVDSSTSPGLELNSAGEYLVSASEDYVRASANPARVEKIES